MNARSGGLGPITAPVLDGRAVPCCGLSSPAGLLETYPGPVAAMSAQFPDPHFKKRHKKRRMVQPSVVQVARERLMPGGKMRQGRVLRLRVGVGLRGDLLAARLWRCPECHRVCSTAATASWALTCAGRLDPFWASTLVLV